jgi:negative regulator of flagellin synthesis FlgM
MKVTDPKFSAVAQVKASTEAPAPKASPVEKVSTKASDRVQATIAQVKAGIPADRSARVQQIAQAVKKGEYQPDPQKIAEQIVDDAELSARLQTMLDP